MPFLLPDTLDRAEKNRFYKFNCYFWKYHKMIKCFKCSIVSATIMLISLAGCTPQTNEIEEPPQIEITRQQPAEPAIPETPKIEPPAVEAEIETPKVEAEQPKPEKEVETKKHEPAKITSPKPAAKPKKVQKKSLLKDIYEDYAEILKNYVDESGMVNYKMLKRKKSELKTTLNKFAKISPAEYNSWTKNEKIAFWLNAYNLHLLKIITYNYPIEASRYRLIFWPPTSIRHLRGIWSDYKIIIMNEEFTLAEINRRFFRNTFDDPRVFFAISRASMSSPPLRNELYKGKKLDQQLDDQVRKFLVSPNGLKIDKNEQEVYLSAILQSNTYGQYFMNKYQTDKKFKDHEPYVRAVLNFITNYTSDQNVYYLERENYSIEFIKYDWRLNE